MLLKYFSASNTTTSKKRPISEISNVNTKTDQKDDSGKTNSFNNPEPPTSTKTTPSLKKLKVSGLQNKKTDAITVKKSLGISEIDEAKWIRELPQKMSGVRELINELQRDEKLSKEQKQVLISQYFEDIAHEIMINHTLIVKPGPNQTKYKTDQKFKICEIEFYLKDEKTQVHYDTFTHGDPVQLTNAKWYMHRMSPTNPMSFKGGNYKGMDLSFGSKASSQDKNEGNIFGGILIRSIMDLQSDQYIEGPCLTITEILKIQGVKECKEMKMATWPQHDGDAFSPESQWYLEKDTELPKQKPIIAKCPRVGLTLKRYDKYKDDYWMQDYRFLSKPHLCKKMRILVLLSLVKKNLTDQEITKIMNVQPGKPNERLLQQIRGIKRDFDAVQKKYGSKNLTIKQIDDKSKSNTDYTALYALFGQTSESN